jgi:hypothetical protein
MKKLISFVFVLTSCIEERLQDAKDKIELADPSECIDVCNAEATTCAYLTATDCMNICNSQLTTCEQTEEDCLTAQWHMYCEGLDSAQEVSECILKIELNCNTPCSTDYTGCAQICNIELQLCMSNGIDCISQCVEAFEAVIKDV